MKHKLLRDVEPHESFVSGDGSRWTLKGKGEFDLIRVKNECKGYDTYLNPDVAVWVIEEGDKAKVVERFSGCRVDGNGETVLHDVPVGSLCRTRSGLEFKVSHQYHCGTMTRVTFEGEDTTFICPSNIYVTVDGISEDKRPIPMRGVDRSPDPVPEREKRAKSKPEDLPDGYSLNAVEVSQSYGVKEPYVSFMARTGMIPALKYRNRWYFNLDDMISVDWDTSVPNRQRIEIDEG